MSQIVACQIDETQGYGEDDMMPTPKKRQINYGPAPAHLVEAVRIELRRLIEQENLDDHLGEIGRFANQADDMLMCVKAPELVMRGEHEITLPGVTSMPENVETYGASILRQIIPALQGFQDAQRNSPEALTHAIAAARRAGMTDVAQELERRLCGKPLEGDRPIDGPTPPATVEAYLDATDKAKAIAATAAAVIDEAAQ